MDAGTWPRVVAHADMDAFYAAVEQLDDPSLRGRPVLVGPRSWRGVVLTASYEARPFGVGSAMPMAEARRRCPQAVIVEPRFERYEEISRRVMRVFRDFSPVVEPISLDEAFLDMTGAHRIFGPPEAIARQIKDAVREATGLPATVGVSGTKYVAKVASGVGKPDGLVVVPPDSARGWLAPLPVSRLWGAGRKTVPRLEALGYLTIGDIAAEERERLAERLGSAGRHFHDLAQARDPRPVDHRRGAASIGSDRTLSRDIAARKDLERHLRRAADRIARRVRAQDYVAAGIRVRLKTAGFELLTRQRRLPRPGDTAAEFFAAADTLLDSFDHPGPFRLVGMAAYGLSWRSYPRQLDLFEDGAARSLETTVDGLIARFGAGVVRRASEIDRRPGAAADVSAGGVNLDGVRGALSDDGEAVA